jgi:levanase
LNRRAGDFSVVPAYEGTFEAPVAVDNGRVTLRIFMDHLSMEVFSGDGLTGQSICVLPSAASDALELSVEGGDALVERLEVYPMLKAIG